MHGNPACRRVRQIRLSATFIVATLALGACAGEDNGAPELLPIADTVFNVNQNGTISIFASDPEDDRLAYTLSMEPEPPTQTMGAMGTPTLTRISNGQAVFSWTPGVADAGESFIDYAVTFTVSDDKKDTSETINLRVVNPGVGGSGNLRFVEPPGAGMAVDLDQRNCVDDLRVAVKADLIADQDVRIDLSEPLIDGAMLSGTEFGKSRTFFWCPGDAQLDQSLAHTVSFSATHGDEKVTKRFLIRFKRSAGAGCAGEPPRIAHEPPGGFNGPLNYEILATITDDVGFKSPPALQFSTDPVMAGVAPDTSGWQLVEFEPAGGDQWRASVPNLNLGDGETQEVHYVILATDNDDPEGTRCDHSTESQVFSFMATGGGGGGGGQTYGFCDPCQFDDQCGGAEDICVNLRGEAFCGRSCAGGCQQGEQCLEVTSIDGVTSEQCLPADLNCGQLCIDDRNEPNNGSADAALIEPGVHADLSICAGDQDFYAVTVEAGQSIRVSARFDNASGDLDLAMALPMEDGFEYQSANGDQDVEQVEEPCVPNSGETLIAVFPFEGSENDYELAVEVGAGDCNRVCEDDPFDERSSNDELDDASLVDLPFDRDGLIICREDPDFYGFEATAGQIISASIDFSHRAGDIDMELFRLQTGDRLAASLSYRDAELIEHMAPADDIYVIKVYGATRSVSNTYSISLSTASVMSCQSTTNCAPGTYCRGGGCEDAACFGFGNCGEGHACIAERVGRDPAADGGVCAANCNGDGDCRDTETCKRFDDFTTHCAPDGVSGLGLRCDRYQDCAGDMVCFPTPGGYCAAGGCVDSGECPAGTVCGELNNALGCLKACQGDADCRVAEGYRCGDVGGGERACVWP